MRGGVRSNGPLVKKYMAEKRPSLTSSISNVWFRAPHSLLFGFRRSGCAVLFCAPKKPRDEEDDVLADARFRSSTLDWMEFDPFLGFVCLKTWCFV